MTEVDDTILKVERLYRALVGKDPPATEAPYAPIPPEKDAEKHVEEQLDRLLNQLGTAPTNASMAPAWHPPMAVFESPQEFLICFDVAGVSREKIQVSLAQNLLVISGERVPPAPGGNGSYGVRLSEIPLGAFRRTVFLPGDAVVDRLSAQFKKGVLEIRLPRTEATVSEARAVPIQ
jgi:HSP20 family protein